MQYILEHPNIVLGSLFAVVVVIFAWLLIDLRRKWSRMFGKHQGSNRDAMGETFERLKEAEKALEDVKPRVDVLERIGKIAIQHVGFLRFNPFEQTGSDQSFAVALLDREGNGIVISSLYTREGVRVYAKQIERGMPKHPLSNEEKKVVDEALAS